VENGGRVLLTGNSWLHDALNPILAQGTQQTDWLALAEQF